MVGRWLASARGSKRLTQKELGKLLHRSESHVLRHENETEDDKVPSEWVWGVHIKTGFPFSPEVAEWLNRQE